MKKNLWEIAEEINEELPGNKSNRFILYGSDDHTSDEAAYIFEKTFDESKMTFLDKMYKFFFEKSFHETKNKPLIKFDHFMNMDYMEVRYIQPLEKEFKQIAKEFSKKYNLKYIKTPKK